MNKKNTTYNNRVKNRLNAVLHDEVTESNIPLRYFEEHTFKEFPIFLLCKEHPILRVSSFHFCYTFLFIQ